jgi:hypothetical protein
MSYGGGRAIERKIADTAFKYHLASDCVGLVGIRRLWRTGMPVGQAIKWGSRNCILWYACCVDRSIFGLSGGRPVNPCHQGVCALETRVETAMECKRKSQLKTPVVQKCVLKKCALRIRAIQNKLPQQLKKERLLRRE